ncbi:CD1375 family protein [Paenibacillus sp. oral taxon 786]|nr:CD1375 family protein [Paenibacillus sp. oral taxon 786]
MIKEYMVKAYAILVKGGRRDIESLPEAYRIPVAEYLAEQEEANV